MAIINSSTLRFNLAALATTPAAAAASTAIGTMECLRRHSAQAASTSRRFQCPNVMGMLPARGLVAHRVSQRQPCMRLSVAAAGAAEPGAPSDEASTSGQEALERWRKLWDMEQFMGDNTFAIQSPLNQEPDLDDPEWQSKVTDWYEFWNHQKWDYEIEGVDDEVDVGGKTPLMSRSRINKLIHAIRDNKLRSDVQNWLPTVTEPMEHISTWDAPPVFPERTPPNPMYSYCDLRAVAEKKARKDMMDREWRRRQEQLVGRLQYPDPYKSDVRFEHFGKDFQELEWSEKRINNLITLGGVAARPEDHGAMVENPLVCIDYVQTMGVHHVEETEDFLESIGHLATPEDEARFEEEVVLDAQDMLGLDEDDFFLNQELEMEEDEEYILEGEDEQ